VTTDGELDSRARRLAALGDPVRLAIVDELARSDRAPVELRHRLGLESNLLAHHLEVLERAGLIARSRSSGDGRRRYVHLRHRALDGLLAETGRPARPALFVCTHNSARSQLAAVLWQRLTGQRASSAGTRPAARVHPGAVAAAARVGLDLGDARPRSLAGVDTTDRLVVAVCDQAHEELPADPDRLHWSLTDPVPARTRAAFDATVAELNDRITAVAPAVGGGR
jgi:protein-tyrosine-phosphatase/DNA-binding transcriptional ArsR family regulator